ncbi:hypothetical protein AYM40_12100 [Paraburkholderia phytofirmans OLGA172]|uniref:Integrase DNA-binding domain-containing protein n=1 Tax=Paraburkholderia phytofirmans OLGA172 TaxID=1417228 RepID=A0A167VZW2_9BURK|nr:hypothetical protein AYM40_12100 [Paraburkholderia phytofirmans OLGA172]
MLPTKTWLLRYRRLGTGKENFLSLGPYPDITLADARRSASTACNLVREGTDPVEHRRAESIARKCVAEGAFHLVAQRWLDFKPKEWVDETYRKAEFVVREYQEDVGRVRERVREDGSVLKGRIENLVGSYSDEP